MKMRAYIQKDWRNSHRLILVHDVLPGKINVLSGLAWTEHSEGDMFDPNMGVGDVDGMLQQIVDQAWEAGFRPAGFAEIKNETAAIREHLADMKAIAFHQLKIKI